MSNNQSVTKAFKAVAGIICISLVAVGCGGTKVQRVAADKEMALTDKWNDEDSRQVAAEMIDDMFSYPWLKRFKKKFPDKEPTITIQRIKNKSHEHIATDTFVNDIKRAVMRSGMAEFTVSGEERDRVREELKQQDMNASEETRMEQGEEMGANFALSGSINSFVDQLEGKRVTSYQIDLKLINLQTTREAWSGSKKIKKLQEKSKFGL
ncbi:MAG: penicillin-binding protein activator LpoB [Gammaproteobacteria bacterium]|nr:penicillin-binding protein activator LpoB [Gammaproteobacteria bacterium]